MMHNGTDSSPQNPEAELKESQLGLDEEKEEKREEIIDDSQEEIIGDSSLYDLAALEKQVARRDISDQNFPPVCDDNLELVERLSQLDAEHWLPADQQNKDKLEQAVLLRDKAVKFSLQIYKSCIDKKLEIHMKKGLIITSDSGEKRYLHPVEVFHSYYSIKRLIQKDSSLTQENISFWEKKINEHKHQVDFLVIQAQLLKQGISRSHYYKIAKTLTFDKNNQKEAVSAALIINSERLAKGLQTLESEYKLNPVQVYLKYKNMNLSERQNLGVKSLTDYVNFRIYLQQAKKVTTDQKLQTEAASWAVKRPGFDKEFEELTSKYLLNPFEAYIEYRGATKKPEVSEKKNIEDEPIWGSIDSYLEFRKHQSKRWASPILSRIDVQDASEQAGIIHDSLKKEQEYQKDLFAYGLLTNSLSAALFVPAIAAVTALVSVVKHSAIAFVTMFEVIGESLRSALNLFRVLRENSSTAKAFNKLKIDNKPEYTSPAEVAAPRNTTASNALARQQNATPFKHRG